MKRFKQSFAALCVAVVLLMCLIPSLSYAEDEEYWIENPHYFQQETGNGCVIASCAILVANYKAMIGEYFVYSDKNGSYTGFQAMYHANGSTDNMNWSTLSKFGMGDRTLISSRSSNSKYYRNYSADQKLQIIVDSLKSSLFGVLVYYNSGASGHMVVVVGYKNGELYVNDPGRSQGGERIRFAKANTTQTEMLNRVTMVLEPYSLTPVETHTHTWNVAGYCTECGQAYVCQETAIQETVVTKKGNVPIWNRPYSNESTKLTDGICLLQGLQLNVSAKIVNHLGNVWYKISGGAYDGGYIYSGNVAPVSELSQYCSHRYSTRYETEHPHQACIKCLICGRVAVRLNATAKRVDCPECYPQPHQCTFDTFVYCEAQHPHYRVYRCSGCGATKVMQDQPTYQSSCAICNPPSSGSGSGSGSGSPSPSPSPSPTPSPSPSPTPAPTESSAAHSAVLLDVTYLAANDPAWRDLSLGKSSYTVGDSGGLITCLAMYESYRLGKAETPATLINSGRAQFDGSGGLLFSCDLYAPYVGADFSLQTIYDLLQKDRPVIVWVFEGQKKRAVLCYGFQGDPNDLTSADFLVYDPFYGAANLGYWNDFSRICMYP